MKDAQAQPALKIAPSSWRAWLLAARPKTLTAALTPVLVGSAAALAEGGLRLGPALAALLVSAGIQIATNLHNDVSDFERGADTSERLGPLRVTQAGLLTPAEVKRGVWACFAMAGAAGLYLAIVSGWWVVPLGMASMLAGWAYSAGPWPLAYNGLADLFVMLFFGFVGVGGTLLVQVGRIPVSGWFLALAVGSTITALLVVNNVRDIESDRIAGRKTLPVRWGRRGGVGEFAVLLILAYLAPVIMAAAGLATPWVLLSLLAVPFGLSLFRDLERGHGAALNRTLGRTGQLILAHGALLSLGLVLGTL